MIGSFTGMTVEKLGENGYKKPPSVTIEEPTVTATTYVFTVTHSEYTGQTWTYTSSTGLTTKGETPATP